MAQSNLREITRWKCMLCGTEYTEKATAERCEEAHKKPLFNKACTPVTYHSIFKKEKEPETANYPDKMTVKFEDGAEIVYIPEDLKKY